MKSARENNGKASQRTRAERRDVAVRTAELPKAVQDYLQKFREWEESFHSSARRSEYIKQLCERIAEHYKPEKIILFGSHAYGRPTPESDIDLLILMDFECSPIQQAIKISRKLGLVTPIDLMVRTPAQVEERLRIEDPFVREIVERGKVMYEADHGSSGCARPKAIGKRRKRCIAPAKFLFTMPPATTANNALKNT